MAKNALRIFRRLPRCFRCRRAIRLSALGAVLSAVDAYGKRCSDRDDVSVLPAHHCRVVCCAGRFGGVVSWLLSARLLDGNLAIDVAAFLRDHGVVFTEKRAFGLREFVVRCTEPDALRLADALELVGTRALIDGNGACLLVVRPEVIHG